MGFEFGALNWLAILASIIVGQVFLTVWFAVVFADPWAKAYGAADKAAHAKDIPGYTYGIGLICMILLSVGLALFQNALGIASIGGALASGLLIAICFCGATILPGYAFLRKIDAALIAAGSQMSVILVVSIILALWK